MSFYENLKDRLLRGDFTVVDDGSSLLVADGSPQLYLAFAGVFYRANLSASLFDVEVWSLYRDGEQALESSVRAVVAALRLFCVVDSTRIMPPQGDWIRHAIRVREV